MNINHVLLLIASLNLMGDLYNIMRFRHQLPGWILAANLTSLALCAAAWLLAPEIAGENSDRLRGGGKIEADDAGPAGAAPGADDEVSHQRKRVLLSLPVD